MIILRLLQDICWTFQQEPYSLRHGLMSVARLLYWHLILKRNGKYHLGTFQTLPFVFDHSSDGCAQAYITPQFEFAVQTYLKMNLQSDSIYVDVGANSGTEALVAAKTGAKVFAFEPTLSVYRLLACTVLLNTERLNISLYCSALSDTDGSISFYTQDDGKALLNSTKRPTNSAVKENLVPSRKLDSFLSEKNIVAVDILKIDVEGAEFSVLTGARKYLTQKSVKTIIWECNSQASLEEREKTRQFLSDLGYTHHYYSPQTASLIPWRGQDDCISILTR